MASFAVFFVLTIMLGAVLFVETSPPVRRAGTRVSGGIPATPKQFPYVAYIKSGSTTSVISSCVGTLITRNAVLTSAYCVKDFNKYTIRFGSIYRTKDDPTAWTVVATWSLYHPIYDQAKDLGNVGIIFLPTKALLSEYIQVVELPRSPHVGSFVGFHARVCGWGQTSQGSALSETLQWAGVSVLPNDICAKHLMEEWVADSKICAGRQHVMDGDDGAPLVVVFEGRYVQIGIHTRRERDDYNATRPALYERLTYYTEWITKKTVHQ